MIAAIGQFISSVAVICLGVSVLIEIQRHRELRDRVRDLAKLTEMALHELGSLGSAEPNGKIDWTLHIRVIREQIQELINRL